VFAESFFGVTLPVTGWTSNFGSVELVVVAAVVLVVVGATVVAVVGVDDELDELDELASSSATDELLVDGFWVTGGVEEDELELELELEAGRFATDDEDDEDEDGWFVAKAGEEVRPPRTMAPVSSAALLIFDRVQFVVRMSCRPPGAVRVTALPEPVSILRIRSGVRLSLIYVTTSFYARYFNESSRDVVVVGKTPTSSVRNVAAMPLYVACSATLSPPQAPVRLTTSSRPVELRR
jgi:hypothetical protein